MKNGARGLKTVLTQVPSERAVRASDSQRTLLNFENSRELFLTEANGIFFFYSHKEEQVIGIQIQKRLKFIVEFSKLAR